MNESWYIKPETEIVLVKGNKKIKKGADNDKVRLYVIYDIDDEGTIELINVKSNVSKRHTDFATKTNKDIGFQVFKITKKHVIDEETNNYNRLVNNKREKDLKPLVDKIGWDAMLRGMIRKGKENWSVKIDYGYGTVTLTMKSNLGKAKVIEELN